MSNYSPRSEEVKERIKKKFKNMSRFSILSNVPYYYIFNAFKKDNELMLKRIESKIESTEDKILDDEVDEKLIKEVKTALGQRDLKEWCSDNGIPHYWLQDFLNGEVIFKQKRVKRLIKLLWPND